MSKQLNSASQMQSTKINEVWFRFSQCQSRTVAVTSKQSIAVHDIMRFFNCYRKDLKRIVWTVYWVNRSLTSALLIVPIRFAVTSFKILLVVQVQHARHLNEIRSSADFLQRNIYLLEAMPSWPMSHNVVWSSFSFHRGE